MPEFEKAVAEMETATEGVTPLTADEAALLADQADANEAMQEAEGEDVATPLPEWVKLPADFKYPPAGRRIIFLKFTPKITERADLGERWCACWSLSVTDERLAAARMMGNSSRFLFEHCKQMLRCIDGKPVDWTMSKKSQAVGVNPDVFMEQIGYKGREMLGTLFTQLHTFNQSERIDFFANCMATLDTASK